MKNTQFTYAQAVARIDAMPDRPIAVEAQWDGDTNGWFLITTTDCGIVDTGVTYTEHLGTISLGGDFRLFTGTVPPYPEAVLATEIGTKLAKKYGLEFFFPSPHRPDDGCPRWEEKDKAIQCEDCDKLIMPTDSPYLPKEVCYHCHLAREEKEKIRLAKPENMIKVFWVKGENVSFKGGGSSFDQTLLSRYVGFHVPTPDVKGVHVRKVGVQELARIHAILETEIEKELEMYQEPDPDDPRTKFQIIDKFMFKDREYALMRILNNDHRRASDLLYLYDEMRGMIDRDTEYHFYFEYGVSDRDASFLQFIRSAEASEVLVNDVVSHYSELLSGSEVIGTLKGLEEMGCLDIDGSSVRLTQIGRHC